MFGHMGGYGPGYGPGNGFFGPGYGNGFGFGGFTEMLLVILIGVVVYMLIKRNQRPGTSTGNVNVTAETNNEALEIAKLRYVKGEITFDEYQKIITTIKN